ncbi:TNF receptor-associated factor 6-like [Oculina patagonica]
MSGFEYAFVSKVSQEYLCPICECPMREPVQTKCGHRFCKHCLEQSMKRKRECPIDRRALKEHSAKDIYPDVAIQRTILDFVIKCPNENYGCKWTGELRSIETHEPDCSFVGVKCTNKDCDATPLMKDLQNHVTHECPKRKVKCLYCKAVSFIWCTRQVHFDVCKKYPMECLQKCGEQIQRDKMNDHIDKSCPHTKLECTYAHVGCKAKVQRKAISDHLKRNTESHLKLACERLQELQDSSTLTTASIEEMQTEIVTAVKKIKELSEEVLNSEGLQDSLCDKIAAINKKLPKFQSRDDATDGRLSALKTDVVTMKTEVAELTEELPSTDGTLSAVQDDITELQKLIPRVDSLQGLRGEVVGAVKIELQKLLESTVTKLNERDRIMLDEIESLQTDIVTIKTEAKELTQELSSTDETLFAVQDDINKLKKQNRIMLDKIEFIKWSLNAQLQDLRDNSARDKMLLDQYRSEQKTLKDFVFVIFGVAILVLCVRYGIFTDLYSRILSILKK